MFGSLTLPYGLSAPIDASANDGWRDSLDGEDLQLFLAIEELLTGERKAYWKHERLDWDLHVKKLQHEDRFHIRYRMPPLEDFEALVDLLGDAIVPNIIVYAGQLVVDRFMKEARSSKFNRKWICAKLTDIRA